MNRRRQAEKLHRHCESCHSRRCKTPIEISVSCAIINCRLVCGAVVHLCEEQDRMLLCPNEKVPCISADFGCPFTMCRSRLAKHLGVCPASVVCCSMEWNRWPIEDTQTPFYDNLLKDANAKLPMDVCMALRDQRLLVRRLKMRTFFPELMEEPEEPILTEEEEAVGGEYLSNGPLANGTGGDLSDKTTRKAAMDEPQLEDSLQKTVDTEKYNLYEKMFSMEKGGCEQAAAAQSNKHKTAERKGHTVPGAPEPHGDLEVPEKMGETENAAPVDLTKCGLAPWQDGVLERLGQQVTPSEFNMYIVHHGRMLISFGQMAACTPREKDFVYGSLEPIPLQTLHSFKVPTSYRGKRINFKDTTTKVKTENKCVGTSESEEAAQKMDEMYATLLCAAEAEIRGHKISATEGKDGLYVDIATQMYNFAYSPFKYDTSLADIAAGRPLKLHVQIETESVTMRHNKSSSVFSFLCGHFFRRDEFASHFKNVHSDIQPSGWFEQRCPLAYLGCTFIQKRFQPSKQRAVVSYDWDLGTFTLRPEVPSSLYKDPQISTSEAKQVRFEDSLSCLPFDVLHHIAGYLDSFTLSQLALVSRLFREVCATLLQERGMVALKWRKKSYSHGGACWKSTIVWEFSHLFSKVDRWCFGDAPSMAEHLRLCPFYQTENRVEPVALASMCDNKEDTEERQGLVTLFMRNK